MAYMEFPSDYSPESGWDWDVPVLNSATRPSFVTATWKMALNNGEEVQMRFFVAPAGFAIPDQIVARGGGRFFNFGVAINAVIETVESVSFIVPANFRWMGSQVVVAGTYIIDNKQWAYTLM